MTSALRFVIAVLATPFLLAVLPSAATAGYLVTLDTSGLSTGFTYALDYQFALGGSNTGNTAILSGFNFGGGGVVGTPTITASVTGDLSSLPIVLSGASGGFAEFTQDFTPGAQLQFTVEATNLPQIGGEDTFTFGILYVDPTTSNLFNIPTSNPSLNDSFVEIDTGGSTPVAIGSMSADPVNFPVPEAQLVPEPSSLALLLGGAAAIVIFSAAQRSRTAIHSILAREY